VNVDKIRHLRRRWTAIHEGGEWIWFVNPKTAHTSIRKIIDPVSNMPWHANWHQYWDNVLPKIDDACLFTIVRNPWDRVVSAYSHLQQSDGQLARRFRSKFGNPPFEEFVTDFLGVEGTGVDRHFAPQVHSFKYKDEIFVEYIGRYENLEHDWAIIANRIAVSPKIVHHLHATEHDHYTTYYNNRTRDIIRNLYGEEIEALGYEFEG